MADISEFYSSGSGSLKPSDIDDDTTVVVEGWRGKTWDDGSKTLYLKLGGLDKELRVNATNARRIGEMYGTKVENWIGKSLTLFVDKVNSPQGGFVDSIIVKVKRTARNAPKRDAHPFAPDNDETPPF